MVSRTSLPHQTLLRYYLKLHRKFPHKKYFVPLAESYRRLDYLEEAAAILQEGLKTHPGYFIGRALLAQTYYQMAHWVQAGMEAEKVLEKAADNLLALKIAVRTYWKLGQLNKSKILLERLLALVPQDPEALNLRAIIHKRGKISSAAQAHPQPQALGRVEDFKIMPAQALPNIRRPENHADKKIDTLNHLLIKILSKTKELP